MVYILAVGAAFANALVSVFQRIAVEDAPKEDTLHIRLIAHALRRGIWLLGFVLLVVSFVVQAVALHFGRMTEVQPILTTELLFLVLVLGFWFRFPVSAREWLGVAALSVGLSGFLVFADPGGGTNVPGNLVWAEVGGSCAIAMIVATAAARRGPRWWRAAMFGAAGAVGFAFAAALTKTVTDYVARDWVTMFQHWQTYGLAVIGLLAVFLAQNAFHAGPIAASQSTLVLVDPLASILIGIGLYGDQIRVTGGYAPMEALALLVMFGGAISLAHSPLVGGVKGEDQEGEMLSRRTRRARRANEAAAPAASAPTQGTSAAAESAATEPAAAAPANPRIL